MKPTQLKIKHRVALLVAMLLMLDVVLFFGSTWLVTRTEQEAAKTQRSLLIASNTSEYINAIYALLHALGNDPYINEKRQESELKLQDLKSVVDEKYDALLNACPEETEARRKVIGIRAQVDKFESNYASALENPDSVRGKNELLYFQHNVEGFIAEVALFNEAQCKVANEGSAAQQNLRSQIKNLLLVGILINIAAALFLGLQLDKTILGRINKIIDNARRLRHKLPLNPELDGSDEIKELDSAFHEMSRALKIEQEQLSASESRNRAFIEGVPIGLLSLDPNGKIEIANLTVASMFEADPKSLIGRNISSLFVIGELSAQDYWTHLKTTACNSTVEVIARTTNGKEFAVEVKLAVEKSGQKSSLASIANVQEKYELTKLRQSVLAVVSHELRTPLTSIAGFLKLVTLGSFGNVSDELKRQAEGAQQSSNRLISLVNDILDLEKLESTASSLKKAPCQLNMIFEESFNSVSIIAKTRGIELRLSPSTCALEIIGDSARIVQVMINLLANAIKFSPDKSDITVNWKQHGGFVTISVQDKGPGIPKEYQKIIFERFQQVSHFNVNSSGGTGLGLPICKTIVEQHGGEIGVQSSTGSGSTFWFTLPCDDDE